MRDRKRKNKRSQIKKKEEEGMLRRKGIRKEGDRDGGPLSWIGTQSKLVMLTKPMRICESARVTCC